MKGFKIVPASGLNCIISDQVARCDYGNLFFPFEISKMIVVDKYGIVSGMFRKIFQETSLVPVNAVERVNHKIAQVPEDKFSGRGQT